MELPAMSLLHLIVIFVTFPLTLAIPSTFSQCSSLPTEDECGGTFTSMQGEIVHNSSVEHDSNTRCVWIVRGINATSVIISAPVLDTTSDVHITGLGLLDAKTDWVPKPGDTVRELVNTNVFVVTFKTSRYNNTIIQAFTLNFSFETDGSNQKAKLSSTDMIIRSGGCWFRHPNVDFGYYENNVLSVFVLIPPPRSFDCTTVAFPSPDFDRDCKDHITAYRYNIGSEDWYTVKRICTSLDVVEIPTDYDMIMLVFQSDNISTGMGFSGVFYPPESNTCPGRYNRLH